MWRRCSWYQLAAEQGDARAQNNLGVMYQNGDGVIMNRDRAAILFRAMYVLDEARSFVHDMSLLERHRTPPC